MIKRSYFMTWKTAIVGGSNKEGHMFVVFKSWRSDPMQAFGAMRRDAEIEAGAAVVVTSFYRVR